MSQLTTRRVIARLFVTNEPETPPDAAGSIWRVGLIPISHPLAAANAIAAGPALWCTEWGTLFQDHNARRSGASSSTSHFSEKYLWLKDFLGVKPGTAKPLLRRESWYGDADAGQFGRPAAACLWGPVASTEHGIDTPHHPMAWANRAVLLADIVESVRLIEQDEVRAISRWLSLVEYVKKEILPRHGGRLVKSLGDGMLMDFADVRSAVSAAFAIQQASARDNTGVAPEQQILLRMGMEVSDVVVEPDDLHGRGVNLAARLMHLAGPGEVVISGHARDQLTPDLDADVEDLGDCYLRHVSEPVRAYRIGPPGPRPVIKPSRSMDEMKPTIAVVPFSPHHVPADRDIIGEVLADEVIRALSRSPDVSVISRLSTTVFRGRAVSVAEIGAILNADYVLSGAYSGDERNVMLDAELSDAKTGRILWTDRLRGSVADLLTGEQELVSRLVSEVSAAVIRRELQRSRAEPLPTLRAYTLMMGAIALLHRLSLRDFNEARTLLQALIDRGVRQPAPLAWLAKWHVLRVQQGWSEDERQDAYLAAEATKHALDMDPECSLALAVDGLVHTHFTKRHDIAMERFDQSIAAEPNNPLAWLLKGTLQAFMSRGDEAVENTQRATKLTPLDPHRYYYDSLAASAYLAAHDYRRALESAQRSLRANRKHTSTLRAMITAQWNLGLHDEARRTARELLQLDPMLTISRWQERNPSAPYPLGHDVAEALRQSGIPN
ncbi:MAG TPA: adenylate/guanylate cyclase domain-containing protein [Alphaproteobacteria bacterium]|nr:adenylate/guanylate cyclase domain-containing protein [Alphaproteobacteria bacterium]